MGTGKTPFSSQASMGTNGNTHSWEVGGSLGLRLRGLVAGLGHLVLLHEPLLPHLFFP